VLFSECHGVVIVKATNILEELAPPKVQCNAIENTNNFDVLEDLGIHFS
jgi:hypothetical protein